MCQQHVYVYIQVAEKRMKCNLETHFMFVDLKKAYDTMSLKRLWKLLTEFGFHEIYVQAVRSLDVFDREHRERSV